jgi:hypothetical protein
METNHSAKRGYALPEGHRERLAATIQAVIDWRRDKAHEAEDAYQDKWARERSNRAFFALKILRTFILLSLSEDDPDLSTFRYSTPQGDRYRICPEAWDSLSRFCMARGNLQESGGKPTEAQMRNVLRRAEGREQQARAEERKAGWLDH